MNDTEKRKLWEKYSKTPTRQLRDQIIIEYAQLVKTVAGRLSMYLGANVEYDDLVSYGIFGLIDAVDKFNINMNVKFETYASLRIRGSIIDEIRKMDWIPRSIRSKQKEYDNVEIKLTSKLNRKPTHSEMIEELGVSEDEYYLTQSKLLATHIDSLDGKLKDTESDKEVADNIEQTTFICPEENALKNELSIKISESLNKLTEREKQTIELYYFNDLTLKEISDVMTVSESRVSQLHTKAILKLKEHLGEYMDLLYKSV